MRESWLASLTQNLHQSGHEGKQTLGEEQSVQLAWSEKGAQPKPETQSCFPLGICSKHKVIIAKSGSLSLKRPVKV